MKPKRAGLYARVSTVDKGQDVGLQLDALRDEAERRDWQVAGEYVDDGISGAKSDRPALQRLLSDVECGRIDLVAVWKLDRLGRSVTHLITLLDGFARHQVEFVSMGESGIDTSTAQGRLMLHISSTFAEYERARIRERVIAGVKRAKARGIHCGRPRVKIQMEIVQALQRQGHSEVDIARMMNVSRSTLRRRLADAAHSIQNRHQTTVS